MSGQLKWQLQSGLLKLQGALDHSSIPYFWPYLQQMTIDKSLTIDISSIVRIDSAGVALLLLWLDRATKKKVKCHLIGISEPLQALFRIYNLYTIMTPYIHSESQLTQPHAQ